MATNRHPTSGTPRFAIIGYAARLPGAADADRYWDVLHDGRDAISKFRSTGGMPTNSSTRIRLRGKVVTRRAGFVDDATGFDAPFFGCLRARPS